MSVIIDFRARIMDAVRDECPELEVDWYDGIFDANDVDEWSLKTPCAWVSVNTMPTLHHTTGEMNADLRCVVAIVESDGRSPRDADSRCWEFMEKVANRANMSQFDDPNAAPATKVKLVRITDPQLRRNGIALGIVEWHSGVTIGTNWNEKHLYFYRPDGSRIVQTPQNLNGEATVVKNGTRSAAEFLGLAPTDETG